MTQAMQPTNSHAQKFPSLLDVLQTRLPKKQFDVWFQRVSLVHWQEGELILGVPNRFYYEWFVSRFADLISSTASELVCGPVDVRFKIVGTTPIAPPAAPAQGSLSSTSSPSTAPNHATPGVRNDAHVPTATPRTQPDQPRRQPPHHAGTSGPQNGPLGGSTSGSVPVRHERSDQGVSEGPRSSEIHPSEEPTMHTSPSNASDVTSYSDATYNKYDAHSTGFPDEHGLLLPGDATARPEEAHRSREEDHFVPRPFSSADVEDVPVRLNPRYTFENFVVGPSNNMAYASAKAVASNPGKGYNPLFLHGSVGLGKTHLLHAICNEFKVRRPGERICVLSCEELTNEFVRSVQRNDHERFRHRFRNVHLLVVDDIHFLQGKERTQEEFFHTFNHLHHLGRQIVLSSDGAPSEIPDLEDRLMSRFQWGLVTNLGRPETETRMAIVRRKAALYQIAVPPDVEELIAANFRHNIRELEGALQSVKAHAEVMECSITLDLAKQALASALRKTRVGVTLDDITNLICDQFHVRVSDLRSKRRGRSISRPRQVIMYLARKRTQMSLEEIGDHFGGRDHSTVLYAVRTVDREIAKNPEFAADIERLEDLLA